jgi:ATP-dependent Clp protease adaptor protein ClpS
VTGRKEGRKGKSMKVAMGAAEPVVMPGKTQEEETLGKERLDSGYVVIVWNDPVNFMEYVTHVFMKVLGWGRARAEKHMREVHEKGSSVVAREGFERAEFLVHQLQGYHLQATMEKAE